MEYPTIRIVREDGLGEDNPTFTMGKGRTWEVVYEGLENFDGVEYEVSTQDYAQYDGARLLNERTTTVDRTISAVGLGDPATLRAQAEAFFIPRRQYEVHVSTSYQERYTVGRQYAFKLTVDNKRGAQLLEWTFLSLDPMWLSEDAKSFDLVEADPHFGFPFISFEEAYSLQPEAGALDAEEVAPVSSIKGFICGVVANRIEMVNEGGAMAYPVFRVTASDTVVNPTITIENASGEEVCRIAFDGLTLQDGDVLIIDFSARPTTFELNGENVSAKVTAGSTLTAGIDVGEFTVTWYADEGDAALSIVPTIHERYPTI